MKKILVVALSVALLLSTTACGTNYELEAKKQKNEQLKQTIDELKKDITDFYRDCGSAWIFKKLS